MGQKYNSKNYNRKNYRKKMPRSGYASFYTGVGYGKASNGDELLGFNSENDRKSFDRGVENHYKYFAPHYKEKKSPKKQGFFARIAAFFRGE